MDTETIEEMRHAIGLDYSKPKRGKYKAYRNYCMYTAPHSIWEKLVQKGYAEYRHEKKPGWIPNESYWYYLTRTGLDLMETMIGAKIEVIR